MLQQVTDGLVAQFIRVFSHSPETDAPPSHKREAACRMAGILYRPFFPGLIYGIVLLTHHTATLRPVPVMQASNTIALLLDACIYY
jgi:hypothetical protein